MNSFVKPLQSRRILFIAPRFFGYEQDILSELVSRGATVDMLPDRPFDTPIMKAATRFGRPLVIGAADRFYRNGLNRFGRSAYDLVFVINGQTLSRAVLSEIRATFPAAKFVLYMWDSFKNRGSAIENLRFFDDCFSFDPDCSREFGLKFRPLFFAPGFECEPSNAFDYHLSFIGTCHSDRFSIVSRLANSLESKVRFYRYLYLQAPWVFYVYRIINPAFRNARITDFQYVPLKRESVQAAFFRSLAVLDIEHPKQDGLTIRTFESFGSSRKLVTTNSHVRQYDFYRPGNICIIDRQTAKIPKGFLETPYEPASDSILMKYSIKGWIDDVIGICDPILRRDPITLRGRADDR